MTGMSRSNNPRPHEWPTDGSLPPHVNDFVEWLVTPSWERDPKTQAAWARAHDVREETVCKWKKEPRVKRQLEKRCDELNLSIDRIQEVINAVFKTAIAGDMKAATLYLQHADKLAPKRVVVEDRRLSAMSDDELREQLAAVGMLPDA